MQNRKIVLAARPDGFPQDSDFECIQCPIEELAEDEFLVQAKFLSVDPYMRGRMSDAPSYADPVEIGQVMVGESVGQIVQSRNKKFPEGSYVSGMFGWQEFAISKARGVRRIDPQVAPISTALHVLGMPGLTAYFGLKDVGRAQAGETVVVTGAAGAVGSVVGQLAKIQGCRAVGIAGSNEKLEYMTAELGFDDGFNYKQTSEYSRAVKELCPDGVDVFFDNVGGPISDGVFTRLNVGARVAICGQISQYNAQEHPTGPRLFGQLIVKRATVKGFLVLDYFDRFREALQQLTEWHQAGKLICRERMTQGIENAPRAFMEMMQGANIGKQLVKI